VPTLRAAAASMDIAADDSMVIGGSIGPVYCRGEEAPLRATALLLEADEPVCIVSCDVLGLGRSLADTIAGGISGVCGIPFDNVLVTATHTHHAPSTFTVHGYGREAGFCHRAVAAAIAAASAARDKLEAASDRPNDGEAELLFALGQEATVGHNSRWLMDDGQISWTGHSPAAMLQPTGPHDCDVPLLCLRRPGYDSSTGVNGGLVAALYVFGTHNIGRVAPGNMRSPGLFGLVARELERRHGAPVLYAPGAFGSSHRPDGSDCAEALRRMVDAVETAMGDLRPALAGPVKCLKTPFTYRIRGFDEAQQDAAVRRWCDRWFDADFAGLTVDVLSDMRRELAPKAGYALDTWLQVIRLGEVAIVGVPGEMFASLGLRIRRLSPFRHTVVIGLANDEIGYIPDREGYELGGYQTWAGFHSQVEPGTGEAMVQAALDLLCEAHDGPRCDRPQPDTLGPDDAVRLQRFYNELSPRSRWLFRPLGWNASYDACAQACANAAAGKRYDVVLRTGERIVGWAFLVQMEAAVPHLGICVAEEWAGRGLGRTLMQALIAEATARGKEGIALIHVKQNEAAGGLYRKLGFEVTGERTGSDGNEYWEMKLTL